MSSKTKVNGAFSERSRLLWLVRPHWRELSFGTLIACIVAALTLIPPFLGKILVDDVYAGRDLSLGWIVIAGMLAARLAHSLLFTAQGAFDMAVGTRISQALSLRLLKQVQRLPLSFFEQRQTGEIQSRFQDARDSYLGIEQAARTLVVQGLYVFIIPSVLLWLEWRLAVLALVAVPIAVAVSVLARCKMNAYWTEAAEASAEFDAFRMQAVANIRLVKTLALEERISRDAEACANDVVARRTRAGRLSWLLAGITYIANDVSKVLYLWYGWHLILDGRLSLGTFLAFEAYIGMLYGPLTAIVNLNASVHQASVQLMRTFEYYDEQPEADLGAASSSASPYIMPGFSRCASFDLSEVSFAYHSEARVLDSITCSIPGGSITALVGSSGSGKSTLLQLLPGLRSPTAGTIQLGGRPLEAYPLPGLRRQVTLVTQDVQLMRGTLWDNLVAARPEAALDEVDEAVEICHLTSWISNLPHGYSTPVAEWGASMSGGQKQRVALARALLTKSAVLLLDEATANIDVLTEQEILRAVFNSRQERTIVFTSHRIASVECADQVLLLECGRLVDQGSHSDLLRTSTPYARLCAAGSYRELGPGGDGTAICSAGTQRMRSLLPDLA